jgi:hypothetical protein
MTASGLQELKPQCGHQTLRYVSEARPATHGSPPTPGGHWKCDQCGASIWPEVLVDRLISEARLQAGHVPPTEDQPSH